MTDFLSSPNIDIRTALQADEITAARALMAQYGDSLSVDLGFQDFEQELASLPGE